MNPLDLPGPQFLELYLWLLLGTFVAIAILRLWPRGPYTHPGPEALKLDPYEVAFLSGGANAAVDAGIATLVHSGVFLVTDNRAYPVTPPPPGATAIERAVFAAIPPKKTASVVAIRSRARKGAGAVRASLRERGLIAGRARAAALWATPVLLFLVLAIFGIAKTYIGISRDRPVGFLVILVLLTVLFAVIAAASRNPFRTGRGTKALEEIKGLNGALRDALETRPDLLSGRDVALIIGAFGVGALQSGALKRFLRPEPTSTGAWSGGGFSSCGGGGSSCGGGGGCGGGGCGGCGGG